MRFFTFPSSRRGVWRRSFFLLLGVSTLTVAAAFAREAREWRDSKGRPIMTSTNEKLVGTLRLDDDSDPTKARIRMGAKTFRFPLAKLSEADREYVEAERAKKNASQTASTRTPGADSDSVSAENASRTLTSIPQDGVKRALLVGVDDYAEFADLKYAVADVEAIRERLVELGFKPENIVELKSTNPANLRPSRRYINRQVDALLKAAGPNDLLFLHFSGHGFQLDDVARFAPEDAGATGDEQVIDPETTISLTEIMDRLRKSDAKFKWMIVDACRENPTETRSAAASARALKNINPPKGMLVLQSCSEGELSYEDADAGRGLFTARLLEAFEGKADFDGDGKMSALDVCKYVSEQTLAASKTRFNATQTPRASAVDFADFAVAEDLKVDGLTREDRARAQTYYDEAFASAQAKKFEEAKEQIAAALEIVADVAETDPAKKRYLERQAMIEMLANAGTSVGASSTTATGTGTTASGSSTGSTASTRSFDRVVSTASELVDAIENASDGDVIALEDGTYRLSKKITLNDKKLTLVGKSGNRERVKIISSGKNEAVFEVNANVPNAVLPPKVELVLEDLSLEAKSWSAIYSLGDSGNSVIKATRCNIASSTNSATISGSAQYVLKECDVFGATNSNGYCQAVNISQGGSLTAENCDFTGGVNINFESQPSSLTSCLIHDSGKSCGVEVSGSVGVVYGPRCEIVDCTIYNVGGYGVFANNGGEAVVRGGEIREVKKGYVSIGVSASYSGGVILDGVKISNCEQGININDEGKCEATNLMFTNVDDKWCVYDDAGSVTHNGRRMTRDD